MDFEKKEQLDLSPDALGMISAIEKFLEPGSKDFKQYCKWTTSRFTIDLPLERQEEHRKKFIDLIEKIKNKEIEIKDAGIEFQSLANGLGLAAGDYFEEIEAELEEKYKKLPPHMKHGGGGYGLTESGELF